MLESKGSRSLEDLSSDEEEAGDSSSSYEANRKSRKKIKIVEDLPKDLTSSKGTLKEVKKRPLERKVESEEDEAEEVKRYKPSSKGERRTPSPPKEDVGSRRRSSSSSSLISTSQKRIGDFSDEDQEEDEDNEESEKKKQLRKSPKRLTLPLMSEIVPESPINEASPKRKDATQISIENLQHDKMKEKERVNDLLKDL